MANLVALMSAAAQRSVTGTAAAVLLLATEHRLYLFGAVAVDIFLDLARLTGSLMALLLTVVDPTV